MSAYRDCIQTNPEYPDPLRAMDLRLVINGVDVPCLTFGVASSRDTSCLSVRLGLLDFVMLRQVVCHRPAMEIRANKCALMTATVSGLSGFEFHVPLLGREYVVVDVLLDLTGLKVHAMEAAL